MANETAGQSEVSGGIGMSDIAREFLAEPQIPGVAADEPAAPKAEAKATVADKKVEPKKQESTSEPTEDEIAALEDAPVEKKTYKLKANGKEYEVDSEEKLINAAQRGLAIQQEWQKAKDELLNLKSHFQEKLKEIEDRDAEIQRDPAGYIKRTNKNAEDVMEQILIDRAREAMAMEQMTPREKELYLQNKKYQEQLRASEESKKAESERAEKELVGQQFEAIRNVFSKALTDASIPANGYTVRVMAAVYRAALSKNVELTAEQCAKLTKAQLDEAYTGYGPNLEEMKADEFVSKYPKLTESIRKHLVEKHRTKAVTTNEAPIARAKDGKFKKTKSFDAGDEWEKQIEQMKKEGHAMNIKARW